jgi:GT2 family glycosyltransferase
MPAPKSSQQDFVATLDPVSGSLAHLLAAFRLPGLIKRALPTAVIAGMYETRKEIRRRLFSRGLSRNRVFEQPLEHKLASASMSVIVAIHDAPLVTKRCLASLERYATNSEIILVDDASKNADTIDIIREFSRRNGWKVISNSPAVGHSAACAAGAELAARPYLCLLNSDTVVTPGCWRPIQEAFKSDPAIGIAGPSTSTSGNEQTLEMAAPCRFHWNDSQLCAFAERLTVSPSEPVIRDLPWISGFALFIHRSLWEQLGGFDGNLPDFGNEIDLCKRATNFGYRTVWVRSSYIHHLGRQSYENEIGHRGIESRLLAAYQYIRQRHSQPHPESTFTSTE